jgi:hypothetical protein
VEGSIDCSRARAARCGRYGESSPDSVRSINVRTPALSSASSLGLESWGVHGYSEARRFGVAQYELGMGRGRWAGWSATLAASACTAEFVHGHEDWILENLDWTRLSECMKVIDDKDDEGEQTAARDMTAWLWKGMRDVGRVIGSRGKRLATAQSPSSYMTT